MKKFALLILLLTCFFSCEETPKHVQEANRVINIFTAYMENCEHFHLSTAGGAMMNKINKITLKYESCREIGIDKTRRLFVANVNKLLTLINSDLAVRPYLHRYPFTINDLNFSLSFYNKKTRFIQGINISYVFCAKGNIHYCNYDSEENLNTIFEEPYEEALKIVDEGQNS